MKPWYREPWPWILMSGPAAVVVAGVATTWIAFATADSLVTEDYYRRGVTINDRLACERTEGGAVRDPERCRRRAMTPARQAR
jgi:hypothetical protein